MNKNEYEQAKYNRDVETLYKKYDKHVGTSGSYKSFAIITIDRNSFKSFDKATAWGKHVIRECESANVDKSRSKYNRVLIGGDLIYDGFTLGDILKEHLSCVKLRKNAALARSIVLTGSHKFQDHLSQAEMNLWTEKNIEFIKKKFGDDCIFAVSHIDETSYHIHLMVSAVEFEPEKRKFFLRNNKYFGGKDKLIQLQDEYSEHISKTFNNFIRGKRGSKAKHVSLQQFYNFMNQKIDTNNLTPQQIENIVKDNYLLSKKYKEMRKTYMEIERDPDVNELLDAISELEENNNTYKSVIQELANSYGVDKKLILSLAKKHSKSKEKEYQRERKRG